ncbi:hypothetical protein AB0K71_34395 [Streptomyces syringium]|uniref:hypothetical protein n=1 Tax=Streptomyces syringium TaxID=76729 RepID=UPI0034157C1F
MPNPVKDVTLTSANDPESLDELRGCCAAMAPHWTSGTPAPAPAPVPPSRIHGVSVPVASARLIDGMSDYGD